MIRRLQRQRKKKKQRVCFLSFDFRSFKLQIAPIEQSFLIISPSSNTPGGPSASSRGRGRALTTRPRALGKCDMQPAVRSAKVPMVKSPKTFLTLVISVSWCFMMFHGIFTLDSRDKSYIELSHQSHPFWSPFENYHCVSPRNWSGAGDNTGKRTSCVEGYVHDEFCSPATRIETNTLTLSIKHACHVPSGKLT